MVVDEEAEVVDEVPDIVADMVAAIEVDKMADMVADMEVDHATDKVADMVVDEVAVEVVSTEIQISQFLPKFHNFDQISQFLLNFTILQFSERVGHGGWLIGTKLRPEACASSKLCKFIGFRYMAV